MEIHGDATQPRKPTAGSFSETCSVAGSTACALSIKPRMQPERGIAMSLGRSTMRLSEYAISSALTAAPSLYVTPSRTLNV